MEIIIDSREQTPLEFCECSTVREKLDVGDYGCRVDDKLLPIFFERKSIGDLYGTLSGGYKRFKKEINRASENGVMLILVIEAPLLKVLRGFKHSTRNPKSLIKQCFTLMVRHKVPCIFFKDSKDMAEYITQTFLAIEREYNGKEYTENQKRDAQNMAGKER